MIKQDSSPHTKRARNARISLWYISYTYIYKHMCVDKFLRNKSYLTHCEVRIKQLHGILIFLLFWSWKSNKFNLVRVISRVLILVFHIFSLKGPSAKQYRVEECHRFWDTYCITTANNKKKTAIKPLRHRLVSWIGCYWNHRPIVYCLQNNLQFTKRIVAYWRDSRSVCLWYPMFYSIIFKF